MPNGRRPVRQPLHLTIAELVIGMVVLATLVVWLQTFLSTRFAITHLTDRLIASVARETVD